MICDVCKKNEATVHLTEIVNDKVAKLHLCESCAKTKGTEMEEHFGLNDLLAGLSDLGSNVESDSTDTGKCKNCGLTYRDFKRIGRFGCGDCYEAFKPQISALLKRIHGSERHVGKIPVGAGKAVRSNKVLQDLRARMEKAILTEQFEEAASLRDRLKELESAQDKDGPKDRPAKG